MGYHHRCTVMGHLFKRKALPAPQQAPCGNEKLASESVGTSRPRNVENYESVFPVGILSPFVAKSSHFGA
jgi:hypothetical protein